MADHAVVAALLHPVDGLNGLGHGALFLAEEEISSGIFGAQQPQMELHRHPADAAFIAKFPVIGGGEGVEIGEVVAVFVHPRQDRFKAAPDAASAAVLGQGSGAAHTAHQAAAAVKIHLKIGDHQKAHHFVGAVLKGCPAVQILFLSGVLRLFVLHGIFKGDGKQLLCAAVFFGGRLSDNHSVSSS